MRVAFMGTPLFAVPILTRLAGVHEVVAVYTRPDAVSARGRRLVAPSVKGEAERLGLPVLQPASLKAPQAAETLRLNRPSVIVVAAYGLILPPDILAIPPDGCVNVHASLLPRHRGAAPVQRTILARDAETGVSIMRMEEGLDTGPVALQRSLPINDLDTGQLTERLAHLGAEALVEALARIEDGSVRWTAQDESRATYAAKITKDDVALYPGIDALTALCRIRASSPQARTRVLVGTMELALIHALPSQEAVPPGIARPSRDGLLLGMADAALLVDRLQPAGKTVVDGSSWARGSRMSGDHPWTRA